METDLLKRDTVLAEIVTRLIGAYAPERIYLFGSKARGDTGEGSDYDLMVVVPHDASPPRRRSRRAYEVLWGTGSAADLIVCTRQYFDSRSRVIASLPATILREGKLLQAAKCITILEIGGENADAQRERSTFVEKRLAELS